MKAKKNYFIIIEASSFQLAYSRFICADYALLLNITNDHIDWHGSMSNYLQSKFKIFRLQKKEHFAFLEDKNLIRKFKNKKYLSKLKDVSIKPYNKIKHKIENKYLNTKNIVWTF